MSAPKVGDKVLLIETRPRDESLLRDIWWERTQPGAEALVVREPSDEDGHYAMMRYLSDDRSFGTEDAYYAPGDRLRVVQRAQYDVDVNKVRANALLGAATFADSILAGAPDVTADALRRGLHGMAAAATQSAYPDAPVTPEDAGVAIDSGFIEVDSEALAEVSDIIYQAKQESTT